MKKLILLGATIFLLAACGEDTSSTKSTDKGEQPLEVNKGLIDVEITLPADFFEEETPEEIESAAKENGVKEVKVNEDGSVYYKMSKSKHNEMMKEMEQGVIDTIDELVNSEDYQSFKEISYNKDFTEFDIKVDPVAYENSFDGFGLMGLAMVSMYYSAFDGKTEDNIKATMHIINNETGEAINTVVFPDDLDDPEGDESGSQTSSSN